MKYPVHDFQDQLWVIADPENAFTPERVLKDSTLVFTRQRDLPRLLEVGTTYWGKIDDRFLQEVFKTIKQNLDSEQYGVEDITRTLGFSRSQLHRKLKALLGKSANQLIVEVRLNEAHRLLSQGAGSVSEVAYSVGYSHLSHFTKSFKNRFNVLPSEVRAGKEEI